MLEKILQYNPRLFTFLNIPVTIHISTIVFLLLYLLLAPSTFVVLVIAFASVIPHEFGHILAARHFGIACRKVILLPLGGMALLEDIPKNWYKELIIAAAGPLVSLTLCLWTLPLALLSMSFTNLILLLTLVNGMLFFFNLLPILPLDGGRMLRAGLASQLHWSRATLISIRLGQGLAIFLGTLSLMTSNWFLAVMMLVLIFLGEGELRKNESPHHQS